MPYLKALYAWRVLTKELDKNGEEKVSRPVEVYVVAVEAIEVRKHLDT